jgi:3'(2'), 5'-bisphosphate nucleotidase
MAYEKEFDIALAAVQKAISLCWQVQKTLVTSETITKKDNSPVTVADLGSQAVICLELLQHFGSDPIVAEEDADTLRDNPDITERVHKLVTAQISDVSNALLLESIASGKKDPGNAKRFWTIDPIDGTKGFLRGEHYAIALALIENGQPVLGMLGCPKYCFDPGQDKTGSLFYALKDQGAFAIAIDQSNRKRSIYTDGISSGSDAKFCESVESAHASHEEHAAISGKLGITSPPFRIDSQAKYAAVAQGDASIYLRLPRSSSYREKIWDHAAGVCITEQAGGQVSDFSGNPLDFTCGEKLEKNIGVLATNGTIHKQALDAISAIMHS